MQAIAENLALADRVSAGLKHLVDELAAPIVVHFQLFDAFDQPADLLQQDVLGLAATGRTYRCAQREEYQ